MRMESNALQQRWFFLFLERKIMRRSTIAPDNGLAWVHQDMWLKTWGRCFSLIFTFRCMLCWNLNCLQHSGKWKFIWSWLQIVEYCCFVIFAHSVSIWFLVDLFSNTRMASHCKTTILFMKMCVCVSTQWQWICCPNKHLLLRHFVQNIVFKRLFVVCCHRVNHSQFVWKKWNPNESHLSNDWMTQTICRDHDPIIYTRPWRPRFDRGHDTRATSDQMVFCF